MFQFTRELDGPSCSFFQNTTCGLLTSFWLSTREKFTCEMFMCLNHMWSFKSNMTQHVSFHMWMAVDVWLNRQSFMWFFKIPAVVDSGQCVFRKTTCELSTHVVSEIHRWSSELFHIRSPLPVIGYGQQNDILLCRRCSVLHVWFLQLVIWLSNVKEWTLQCNGALEQLQERETDRSVVGLSSSSSLSSSSLGEFFTLL